MSWQTLYRSKLCTAAQAVASLRPNDKVYMGGNAATPWALADALAERAEEVSGLRLAHVLLMGRDPFEHCREHIRHFAYFVGPADRQGVADGRADFVPSHLSEIPRLIRADGLDAALLMTSPPDSHGFLSLGVEVLCSLAAAEVADRVIVLVNPRMPRVMGNSFVHVSQVHAIVEQASDLIELKPRAPSDVERQIARYIVDLIPDKATLQLGIGGIPDAVVALLEGRSGLGIHTEMLSDGVMRAVQQGVITGEHKTLHHRKCITTFMLGSKELYEWAHENPMIEIHPADYTNDIMVAARNDNLVAINSALSVDITGQVNSDSIGTRIYSGVGGQVDFIRAAARSKGGKPIIALPASAKKGQLSRIVGMLEPGAGVVTSRASVHYIVTEYGVAYLFGKSLRERAKALIAISAPPFRDELTEAARARKLL